MEKWILRRGVRRPAARLHPAAAEEPDVAFLGPARAGPAVQAAVRPDPPFVRLYRCRPVRRDFSAVLEACGNDLDQAVARAEGDYTAGAGQDLRGRAGTRPRRAGGGGGLRRAPGRGPLGEGRDLAGRLSD